MAFKGHRVFSALRRRYPSNVFGHPRSVPSYLRVLEKRQWVKRPVKPVGDCSITRPKSWWPIGEPQQHFGPKARIPDLFQRKDDIHLKLAAQQLEWYETPPRLHHDLLGAVARVGRLEERIKYTFKNKMTCVEALKVTSSVTPLFFKGIVHKIDRNNRLALLGDRVLGLVLCEIWFPTGNSLSDYMKMHTDVESRASLAEKGRTLGMDKELLLPEGVDDPETFQIAEAFEAVIGAIYLDSGKSIEVVKQVINSIKLDDHKYLRPDPKSRNAQNRRERWYHHAEGELLHGKTELLEHEALALQKEVHDVDAPVVKHQEEKPPDDSQRQMNAKTKAETLTHKATALHSATEDANTSVEELRDNMAIDTQMEVHIKRRVEYLTSLSSRKKGNSIAFRKGQHESKPSVNSTTRADKNKNAVHDLQPVETSEPPECTNANIVDLVKAIQVFHKKKNKTSSWRARKRWAIEYSELLKQAWDAATKQALDLRELRLPADAKTLYEEIVKEKLEAVLDREQRCKRKWEIVHAMKQSLAPKDLQQTDSPGAEEHNSSGLAQETPSNQENRQRCATKPMPPQDRLEQDGFDFLFPDGLTTETRSTCVWTPEKPKKTVARNKTVDPTQKRVPPRYARRAKHCMGPGDL